MISGLAHVCFRVKDLSRAMAFYSDGLGFAEAFDFINAEGRRFGVYLKTGGRVFLELFESPGVAGEQPGQSYGHICLEVADIVAATTGLRVRGIEVTEPQLGSDRSWQAWLADPDGNRIELHQYTPESWQTPHLER